MVTEQLLITTRTYLPRVIGPPRIDELSGDVHHLKGHCYAADLRDMTTYNEYGR